LTLLISAYVYVWNLALPLSPLSCPCLRLSGPSAPGPHSSVEGIEELGSRWDGGVRDGETSRKVCVHPETKTSSKIHWQAWQGIVIVFDIVWQR
jgi:hypothetical protein